VFFLQLLQRNFIYNSVTARREALLSVGGYDERLWVGEDWELWLRLAAAGFRFVRVPQRLAVYRARARSLTSDSARLLAGRQEVYRVVAEDWPDGGEFRDLALNLRRARASRVRPRALGRRVLKPLLTAWRVVRDANLWYQEAPREVADLLMAVATPPEG
jgi:GT2 family glycosyltransferase